jgi:hypothetical protein
MPQTANPTPRNPATPAICAGAVDGRRYPGPEHADGCPAQVRERFVRVEWHGNSWVIEPREVAYMREDLCADEYTFTDVMLTRDQFERMDEFQGF